MNAALICILLAMVIVLCGAFVTAGSTIVSIDAHYSDGSKISTTNPSVLAAAGNAIAATQPAKPVASGQLPVASTKPVVPVLTNPGALNAAKWSGDREFFLGAGTFSLNPQSIAAGTSIYIHSADPAHTATISITEAPATISDSGTVKITDCKIVGGAKATFIQTHGQGNCELDNVTSDGACLFWGEGGNIVTLTNCTAAGSPANYAVCNFDAPLASLTINGGSYAQGKNQAAIRLMQVTSSLVENCTFIGSDFKQCIQDRSGGIHVWKNVTVKCTPGRGYTADIGPMTWEDYSTPANTPQPLQLSEWIDCSLPDYPLVERPGNRITVKRIVYQHCTIAGQVVNKDFN